MSSGPGPVPDPVAGSQRRPALSPRELEILRLWLRSESRAVAASELGIRLGTIQTHLTRIRAKYAAVGRPVADKSGLLVRALQDGLVSLDEL
ncbi:response regulator transcription factor [Rhodococcus sp. NCIMB 12038]|uniref:response regulator transcription factor n=1 Tax=Rhodococcus sp. NCIMB 12038 TaxID=933800 RepID=UPI000B3BE8C7|nr:LuxR C-terminal-related transcriptional regulator [Rhodococcus sp. NCIMB 12038]OUS97299.1 helix-turn-helix transcriptional regulator [Rhodococcus sp. NCIMB 12038]